MEKGKERSIGFTLIELLVVIAIIALLLSIMMPALQRVKEKAKATVCQTRMKQWNIVTTAYGNDNNFKFPDYTYKGGGHWWMQPLRPYYTDSKIRLCPSAYLPPTNDGWTSNRRYNECWATHNPFPELDPGDVLYGSLGPNCWLMDISNRAVASQDNYWGSLNQAGFNVPLFLDCWWVDGWPKDADIPQDKPDNGSTWDIVGNHMQRFNTDRHNGRVSAVFVDGSCEMVGLKRLWRLKWHRKFDSSNASTRPEYVWPDWMRNIPDD